MPEDQVIESKESGPEYYRDIILPKILEREGIDYKLPWPERLAQIRFTDVIRHPITRLLLVGYLSTLDLYNTIDRFITTQIPVPKMEDISAIPKLTPETRADLRLVDETENPLKPTLILTPTPIEPKPSSAALSTPPPELERINVSKTNFSEYSLGGELINDIHTQRELDIDKDLFLPELRQADTLNFLFLGTDNTRDRPDEFDKRVVENRMGNSDVIKFFSYNIHTEQFVIITIPRDLWDPDIQDKINANTNQGDPGNEDLEKMRRKIQLAVKAPIDFVIQSDIDTFQGGRPYNDQPATTSILRDIRPQGFLVNMLHSVQNKRYPGQDYSYTEVNLTKGEQTLNEKQITQAARDRSGSNGAFGRDLQMLEIFKPIFEEIILSVASDAALGRTNYLEKLFNAILYQEQSNNMRIYSPGFDYKKIAKVLEKKVVLLGQYPHAAATIAGNSRDRFDPSKIITASYEFSNAPGKGLVSIHQTDFMPNGSYPNEDEKDYFASMGKTSEQVLLEALHQN